MSRWCIVLWKSYSTFISLMPLAIGYCPVTPDSCTTARTNNPSLPARVRLQLEIFSQEELLLQTLTEMMRTTVAEGAETYNAMLTEYLTELVKERLVKLGQAERSGATTRSGLLDQAYREAVQRLQERLEPYEIQFDFRRYQDAIYETLKALAKEIAELQGALRESRHEEKIPFQVLIEVGEQVAFQIFEVGSPRDGETEALVVLPISQQCSLDFHLLREECKLDGRWFPFQLTYRDTDMGELVFVCDQDGSLCLYTHNFPGEILKRVREILKAIAGKLYSQDAPEEGWYLSDEG